MTGDQVASLALTGGCIVLVGGSIMSRRLPARRVIGMAAAWVGVFALAALVASLIR